MLEYLQVPIWSKYQTICDQAEGSRVNIYKQERFEFYERAKQAYAIVATGETALYGNVILKKGVIPGDDWSSCPRFFWPNAFESVIINPVSYF